MLITVSLFLQISVNIFNCRARSMAPYIQNERFGRKAETLIFSMCTDAGYTCHSLKSQFPIMYNNGHVDKVQSSKNRLIICGKLCE